VAAKRNEAVSFPYGPARCVLQIDRLTATIVLDSRRCALRLHRHNRVALPQRQELFVRFLAVSLAQKISRCFAPISSLDIPVSSCVLTGLPQPRTRPCLNGVRTQNSTNKVMCGLSNDDSLRRLLNKAHDVLSVVQLVDGVAKLYSLAFGVTAQRQRLPCVSND
jgi:hypothetical protein